MGVVLNETDTLDLTPFIGKNDNCKKGRRNSISSRLRNAANAVAGGQTNAAEALLLSLYRKVDGDPAQPDWLVPSSEKTMLHDSVLLLLSLLLT